MATVVTMTDSSHLITRTINDVKIPRVKKRKTDVVGQMYTIEWPESTELSLTEKLNKMMGKVSLFATDKQERDAKKKQELAELLEPRPMTPINEAIPSAPVSLKQLLRYIRRRLQPRPDVKYLTEEDQRQLADILIGEVQFIWQDMKHQIDDPFLTNAENCEMARRICVYVVTACEDLFNYYLTRLHILYERNVFTDRANKSRLRAQLALHTHKILNIHAIRRHIIEKLRLQRDNGDVNLTDFHPEILKSQQLSKVEKEEIHTGFLMDLYQAMPQLEMEKVMPLLRNLPEVNDNSDSYNSPDAMSNVNGTEFRMTPTLRSSPWHKYNLKATDSMPSLRVETLFDELGISKDQGQRSASVCNVDITKYSSPKLQNPTREEMVRNDLHQLMLSKVCVENDMPENDDLPPLLQAITHSTKDNCKRDKYQTILQDMEEREREIAKKKSKKILQPEPPHPQPATVNITLPNQMVVKVADVRVSNRVCQSAMFLHHYKPLYNDLMGEISSDTAKDLDKGLYIKAEIREVYKEIMKNISRQHFDVANVSMVEISPSNTAWNNYRSKSVIEKCKERGVIVNKQLEKCSAAPWGDIEIDEWCRVPDGDEADHQLPCFAPDLESMEDRMRAINDMSGGVAGDMPSMYYERMKRLYDMWLAWWRNHLDIKDYKKYLALHRTDYLAVIFHLYEDQSEMEAENRRLLEQTLLKQNKDKLSAKERATLESLRSVKEHYEPGMWNAASVLLGGLGSDPPLHKKNADTTNMGSLSSTRSPTPSMSDTHRRTSATRTVPESSKLKRFLEKIIEGVVVDPLPKIQERLEKIWNDLKMPEPQRLDMAIKYSNVRMLEQLKKAVFDWEYITDWILKREDAMSRLEKFERRASDPDRFFHRDKGNAAIPRFQEAKRRKALHAPTVCLCEQLQELEGYERRIRKQMVSIKRQFNDVVTFSGRDYNAKMKWDKIEMLYWLHEERKQNAIKYEVITQGLNIKPSHLEPLFM